MRGGELRGRGGKSPGDCLFESFMLPSSYLLQACSSWHRWYSTFRCLWLEATWHTLATSAWQQVGTMDLVCALLS